MSYITKYIINISLLMMVLTHIGNSQPIYTHNQKVKELYVHADGRLIFSDINGRYYLIEQEKTTELSWLSSDMTLRKNDKTIIAHDLQNYYTLTDTISPLDIKIDRPQNYFFDNRHEYFVGHDKVHIRNIENKQTSSCAIPVFLSSEDILAAHQVNNKLFVLYDKGMTELCLDDFMYTQVANFVPTASLLYDDLTILIGSDMSGIWTFESDIFKRFFVQGVQFPLQIKSLSSIKDHILINSHDAGLQAYDVNQQTIRSISASAEDYDVDSWNVIYYCKDKQIHKYTALKNEKTPQITLTNISDGLKSYQSDMTLESGKNLIIHYQTNYPPAQKAVSVEYSVNNIWKTHKGDGPIILSGLESGDYIVHLKATHDGQYYSESEKIEFKVKGTPWKSIWTYLFSALILLLGLSLFFIYRNRRIMKDLDQQKKNIRQELEVLRSQQKLGLLQLSPHFLFNVLNSISGLVALNDNQTARRALNQFSHMMRSLLDNSDLEVIPIKEEIKFLNNYLDLELMMRPDAFTYNISADEDVTHIRPMLIQPFLENSIIHGFASLDRQGHLTCDIFGKGHYTEVVIRDNGVGRNAATNKKRKSNHQSKGINIIKNRLKTLDRKSAENHVQYTDLYDDNGSACGTKVLIKIPNK